MSSKRARALVDKLRVALEGYRLDQKRVKRQRAVTKTLMKTRMNVDRIQPTTLGLADNAEGIPRGAQTRDRGVASGWGKTANAIGANERYRKWERVRNRTDEENERDLAP